MKNIFSSLYSWLDERTHISPAVEHVKHKEVAQHRNSIWYYFGGFALFLVGIQILSGTILLTRYEPSATPAADPTTGKPLCIACAIDSIVVVTVVDSELFTYSLGDQLAFKYSGIIDSALPEDLRGKVKVDYTIPKDSMMMVSYTTTAEIAKDTSAQKSDSSGEATQAKPPTAQLTQTPDVPELLLPHIAILRDTTSGEIIHPSTAYTSVQHIMTDVPMGKIIRSIHAYGANLLVACILLHMFSVFLLHGYRKPNELMWMTGVALLALILGFGFTGYLLPWTKLSYFATRVGVGYPENFIPGIGKLMANLMRGGREVTGETLLRMFDLHVVVLPLTALLFVAIHISLLQVRTTSVPVGAKQSGMNIVAAMLGAVALGTLIIYKATTHEFDYGSPWFIIPITILPVVAGFFLSRVLMGSGKSADGSLAPIRFYWNFAMRDYVVWLFGLVALVLLAIYAPWQTTGESGMPVDITKPLVTPIGIHPEWYYMAAFELLRLIPGEIAMIAVAAGGVAWFLVPFLDKDSQAGRRSPRFMRIGIIIIVAFLALTWLGYQAVNDEVQQAQMSEKAK